MISLIIGVSSGILLIVLFTILKKFDKKLVYGLILVGIAFLYIGFTWSHLPSLIITSIQALVFIALAYFGVKKSLVIIAIGYFLHGSWDLAYNLLDTPRLIPPDYDIFCLSIDFVIGGYLLILSNTIKRQKTLLNAGA